MKTALEISLHDYHFNSTNTFCNEINVNKTLFGAFRVDRAVEKIKVNLKPHQS